MPIQVNILQAWKHTVRARTRITGVWRELPQAYVKVNGEWKSLYSFFWESGEWSGCSAGCGGGVQNREVKCKRSDGLYYDDIVCARSAGIKPDSSQICNVHPCSECRYDYNTSDGSGKNFWYVLFAGGGSITIGYACGDIIYPSAAACSQSCAEGHCAPFTVDMGSWGTATIITWDGISVSGDSGLDGELFSYTVGGYTYSRGSEISRDAWGAYYQVCRQAA